MSTMSLEAKVGQMFIARCPEESQLEAITQYQPGGYILFARDFASSDTQTVQQTLASYQSTSQIPMLIGVDEEGGTVVRVSSYEQYGHTPFLSPQQVFSNGGFSAIQQDTQDKDAFLKNLGINVNFAPVADVSQDANDFIYARAFGQDASQTSTFVKTVVTQMQEDRIGSVLKHFPGYGNNVDTHTGVAYDNRDYATFTQSDFLPFQAGIEAGANMVLVSHNIVSCIDAQYPASISEPVHKILRDNLGFNGVIMTDDLIMEGVRQYADDASIAIMAVQAGNDLLCCTDFQTQIPAVIQAVQQGTITEERINASVYRILKMKYQLGIIQ